MAMGENPREQQDYVRLLELISVITEEWGEATKDINNYLWKGRDTEHARKAINEIKQLQSPLNEMTAMLELQLKRK
jgi:DNA-binding ferritin-like protein (Dps family)